MLHSCPPERQHGFRIDVPKNAEALTPTTLAASLQRWAYISPLSRLMLEVGGESPEDWQSDCFSTPSEGLLLAGAV